MFRPNLPCLIHPSSGETDVYGQPIWAAPVRESCAIVKMSIKEVKSPLRAGVSATVGNARESESDAKILLQAKTIAKIDDVIEVSGVKLRISARELAYDVRGRIDHCKISCDYWSGA